MHGSAITDAYIDSLFDREPWPHQRYGVGEVIEHLESSTDPLCLTSPTGGGKTSIMVALIRHAVNRGRRVGLYTMRNLLLEQTAKVLDEHGIQFGIRAAKHSSAYNPHRDVQLCSIQTELARLGKTPGWELHDADLTLWDEAHLARSGGSENLIKQHMLYGGTPVGITATPLGLSHIYKRLVVAGRTSDLRRCGALVPAIMYAPDELDCSRIKPTCTGEFSLGDIRKKVWTPAIIGRVYDNWKLLNPEARPALGFAPGVQESIWFAEEFTKRGVRAAHIDGSDCWVDGELYKGDDEARHQILADMKAGEIPIVWNRFVLREGLDLPFCYHLILATPIGSLKSYIQVVGRVLRKSPETPDHVIITDHGGSWWRNGSPNEDRHWEKVWDQPERTISETRLDTIREKHEPEPITCPRCKMVRRSGRKCPDPPVGCGFEYSKKSRIVLQHDGTLKEVTGDILKAKRRVHRSQSQQWWDDLYYPSSKTKGRSSTFKQLEARYLLEHHEYPPRNLKNMPKDPVDWFRKAKHVPKDRLL